MRDDDVAEVDVMIVDAGTLPSMRPTQKKARPRRRYPVAMLCPDCGVPVLAATCGPAMSAADRAAIMLAIVAVHRQASHGVAGTAA